MPFKKTPRHIFGKKIVEKQNQNLKEKSRIQELNHHLLDQNDTWRTCTRSCYCQALRKRMDHLEPFSIHQSWK